MRMTMLLMGMCVLGGCGVLTPTTAVSYSPIWGFSFADTKDNDVEIVGLEVDPATRRIKCAKLTIRNNASDPIRENVAQIRELNEQFRIHGQNLIGMMQQLTSIAGLFAPGVSASGPLGTSVDVSGAGLKAIIEGIVEAQLRGRVPPEGIPPASHPQE